MSNYSLSTLMPITGRNLQLAGGKTTPAQIHQVAKTMEGVFVGQLMAEMSKSIGGDSQESSTYHDFVQQAMTQQVTSGSGFGLTPVIERYLQDKMKSTVDPAVKTASPQP